MTPSRFMFRPLDLDASARHRVDRNATLQAHPVSDGVRQKRHGRRRAPRYSVPPPTDRFHLRRASLPPPSTQALRTFGIGVPVDTALARRHGGNHGFQRHPPRSGSRAGDARRGAAGRGPVRGHAHHGLDGGSRRDARGRGARPRTARRAARRRRRCARRPPHRRPTRRARGPAGRHRGHDRHHSGTGRFERWRRIAGRSGRRRARRGSHQPCRRSFDRRGPPCRTGPRPGRGPGAKRRERHRRRLARGRRGGAR